jgi:hypothetical protein
MPTTPSSSKAAASANKEFADLLANSQTSTIYVDADLNDKDAASLLLGDPPLFVEFDHVRQQWAVRKATEQEVEAAQAGVDASSTSGAGTSSPVDGVKTSST